MPEARRTSGRAIVFGAVPDIDDAQTRTFFDDLCAALSRTSGQRIEARRCASPQALAEAFGAGEIELGWASPTLLLTAAALRKAVPLVRSVRRGLTEFHGVAFVRDDSEIRSMLDLKGKRAAWVAPSSASGYIFARLVLASHGIDPTTHFASETFYHSHGIVARAVLEGKADVGGVYALFEEGNPTRRLLRAPFLDIEPSSPWARILFTTAAIPSDLIIAAPSLSPEVRERIGAAFESIHDHPVAHAPLMHIFGAESFVRHDPASLAPLREQVEYGRELGLLD